MFTSISIEFHLELQNLNSSLEFCESKRRIFTKCMKCFPERLISIIPHSNRTTAKSPLNPNTAGLSQPHSITTKCAGFVEWEGVGASENWLMKCMWTANQPEVNISTHFNSLGNNNGCISTSMSLKSCKCKWPCCYSCLQIMLKPMLSIYSAWLINLLTFL